MSERMAEFSDREVASVLAAVRVGRGLYFTTHARHDPEGHGAELIDQVITLLAWERQRRDLGDEEMQCVGMAIADMRKARALLIAVRSSFYGVGPDGSDHFLDIILDLILDEMDRTEALDHCVDRSGS
jgi:hypothetical protein